MRSHIRIAFGAAALALSAAAQAGEVSYQLTSVTTATCNEEYDGYYGYYGYYYTNCSTPAALSLSPAAPQGAGSVDLDRVGNFIGGTVSLDAHTVDGVLVPAWSTTFARTSSGALESTAFSGVGPWGSSGAYADFWLTRFDGQGDFDGGIRVTEQSDATDPQGVRTRTTRISTYAFSSVAGSPLACPGERLYLDVDGDGEEDSRDRIPWWLDSSFGAGVDENGLSIAEFCGMQPTLRCRRADFRNDEPLRKKPRDCAAITQNQSTSCRATEFAAAAPIAALRSCQGLALFDDTDGDGEPDATDRCPATPAGSAIDGSGCSLLQFCEAQPVLACRRADFGNDEPTLKKPRDCARTRTKPRSCTAASAP